MDLKLEDFKPKPATWLKTKIEYVGVGRAVFEDPAGVIKGSAKATFDEDGSCSIEMEAEKVEAPDLSSKPWNPIMYILTGQEPVKREEGYAWPGLSINENNCTQLTITTSEGIFSVIGKINYYHSTRKLRFFIIQSKFEVESPGKEYYWVLPLTNFIFNFTQRDKALDQHPLRIYRTPVVPEGLSQEENNLADLHANSKNCLVIFEYFKKLAFIEAIHSYKESKEKLREGKEKALITAIMVGQVNPSTSTQNDSTKPSSLLPFLGLASGSSVGSPWMEFYDKQGKLICRIHQSSNKGAYREGHVILHDYIGSSKAGNFLTLAQASQSSPKDYASDVASLAMEGGFFRSNHVDPLANLFRAFEILCKEYGLKNEYLLRGVDEIYQKQIEQILKKARNEIQEIANSITDANLGSQKRSVERIAERVLSAKDKESDSGLAISKLLDKLGFPDAAILDNHYRFHPRPDKRSWPALLSYCRGVAMHDIRIKDSDLDDLLIVKDHLYDILIRIVFHLIGYQGTYTSIFTKDTSDEISVDWVDPNLPANRLGYK